MIDYDELEKYYSKKSVIERNTVLNKKYSLKKLVTTKTEGTYVDQAINFRTQSLFHNMIIKNMSINVSLKKL